MEVGIMNSPMTNKSIIKYANAKIISWLNSIEDKTLRDKCTNDIILTGGSIASMIEGSRINDFDFYFKTKETVIALAKYYLKKAYNLQEEPDDLELKDFSEESKKVATSGKDICILHNDERVYIFIRSTGVYNSEYDSPEPDDELEEELKEEKDNKYYPKFITGNAISLSGGVQLITRFFGEVEKIHENFDYVHAMSSYDYANRNLITPVETLRAIQTKRLVYKGSKYPICSLFRMRKFLDRGWRITAGEILKMAWQVSKLDLSNIDVIEDQLIGVDYVYMNTLINALVNVDKDKLEDVYYVTEIIDRIFGDGDIMDYPDENEDDL